MADRNGFERLISPFGSGIQYKGLCWSPDDRHLAVAQNAEPYHVEVWSALDEKFLAECAGHESSVYSVAFSPDGRRLASGSWDKTIRLWDAETGAELLRLETHTGPFNSMAFSPDGRRLASASKDGAFAIWDMAGLVEPVAKLHTLAGPLAQWLVRQTATVGRRPPGTLSPQQDDWVPHLEGADGQGCVGLIQTNTGESSSSKVVLGPDSRCLYGGTSSGEVRAWDLNTGHLLWCVQSHHGRIEDLALRSDGRRLASGSQDNTIRLWDAETGAELARLEGHTDNVKSVAFSPGGRRLASGSWDNTIRIWDTRAQDMLPPPPHKGRESISPASIGGKGRDDRSLPAELTPLPAAWATLHRLGVSLPLSLLRDLRALLGGEKPDTLNELAAHPGIRSLAALRWPTAARSGLMALLLHGWEGGTEWKPPNGTDTSELRKMLAEALSGSPCEPDIPAPPLGFLSRAADGVDERLITLLTALGPRAVMDDPALPLQLRREVPKLPALTRSQRHLLELRITPLDAGSAQGSGAGMDRSGFSRRGPVTALVPSQLALPEDLLLWRYLNGGLLYRTCSGQEPPQLRPVVIVLDTSPAGFGPIGALIRPAAHALADTLAQKRMPAVFLSAGDGLVFLLDRPGDRLRLLIHRHNRLADPVVTLNKALNLLDHLRDGPMVPVVLLLTHSHWGSEVPPPPAVHLLRALFVHYPGSSPRPPWADWCERWETLRHNQFDGVAAALGRLIG